MVSFHTLRRGHNEIKKIKLFISHDCKSEEEIIIMKFYTFSLCGNIGPTQGP